MSRDCCSNYPHHVQALLADFLSLFSFILSHPLCFAYLLLFLLFSVKFLSFLSPLLMSTSLLLLISLLTVSPHFEKPTRYGFLVNAFQKIVDALQTRVDDNVEFYLFGSLVSMALELEACMGVEALSYKGLEDYSIAVEGTSNVEKAQVENPQENNGLGAYKSSSMVVSQELASSVEENCSRAYRQNDGMDAFECQELNPSLENLWREFETKINEPQALNSNLGEQLVEVPQQNGELGEFEHKELNVFMGLGSLGCKRRTRGVASKGMNHNAGENAIEFPQQNDESRTHEHQEFKTSHLGCETGSVVSQGLTCKVGKNLVQVMDRNGKENFDVMDPNPGGFGSMRKEKEWKRTLACKLFEERQSIDGTEGMDQLWEVYEVDSKKGKAKNKKEKAKKEDIDHYEEEEEEDLDSQLCCLQALRFSTGKMNLGMRRLNSMRIPKAFKGMGLFVRKERKVF